MKPVLTRTVIISLTYALLFLGSSPLSRAAPPSYLPFLHVSGVPGNSTDSTHKDWIECFSFQSGVALQGTGTVGGGGIGGVRADFHDLTIVKEVDKASPKLYIATAKGDHFQDVTLEVTRSSGSYTGAVYQIRLTDVIVRSVRLTYGQAPLASGVSLVPLEEVSFAFAKIEWIFTEVDSKGKPKGDSKGTWDLGLNQGN